MMRIPIGIIICLFVCPYPLPSGGRACPLEQAATLRDYDVHGISALDALIRLGQLYDRPMGIVSGDKRIVATQVTVRTSQGTVQEAMDSVMGRLPDYKWKDSGGVLVIEPRAVSPVAAKLLRTTIAKFSARDSTPEQLSALLWWKLQRIVDPQTAAQGYWGVSHDRVRIGSVDIVNASVEEILNEIVRRRGSAAWIVLPLPETLKGAQRDRLWGIVNYASPPQPLDQLCCLNQEYFK